MKFSTKSSNIEQQRSECIQVCIYEAKTLAGKLSDSASLLDKKSKGYISRILKQGDLQAKVGQTLLLHHVPNLACTRVLLVGCGEKKELDPIKYRQIITNATRVFMDIGISEATLCVTELNITSHDSLWKVRQAMTTIASTCYQFEELKSKPRPACKLKQLQFHATSKKDEKLIREGITQGLALSVGMNHTKNLAMLPGNICQPSYLAKEARQLAKQYSKLTCNVLNEAQMKKLKMGAFLAVSQGSALEAQLITLEYKGATAKKQPIVFVGKGITFDTGGINLKPGSAINGMKYDMCGAASVIGIMHSIAELGLPLNVIGVIASAENMPSGTATRPDDVVTSMSGQTIEIDNTDAEGRLVLCDTLTYVERFKPKVVIDMATLTGACIVALGNHASGLFSNHQLLADALIDAGEESGDRAWQMPVWDEYQSQLDSTVADMRNTGGRAGGSITAACFLSRFTKAYHWAHLDIAGTAMPSGQQTIATGRPVTLVFQYLLNQCKA